MSIGGTLQALAEPISPQVLTLPPTRGRRRTGGIVLAEQIMTTPAAYRVASGTAVAFSTRSPSKSTPNEDVVAIVPTGADSGVLMVADGLGGQATGEQASRLAVETIRRRLIQFAAEDDVGSDSLRSAILNGIEAANEAVLKLGSGAATTLALVEIQGNVVRPYHVGDSEILLAGQRGKLKLQTIAHSPIGYAVESGLLDEKDAMHHEERHVISNVIGSAEMRIEIGPPIEMARRDTLLVASDGLFDNLFPADVVEGIRSGPLVDGVGRLADEALDRMNSIDDKSPSKPDDLTLLAFRLA
jgi:serine/threonine protein phosphatase PrpC